QGGQADRVVPAIVLEVHAAHPGLLSRQPKHSHARDPTARSRLTSSDFVAKALSHGAGLAQLVEQRFCKPKVAGSSPASGTASQTPFQKFTRRPALSLLRLAATKGASGVQCGRRSLRLTPPTAWPPGWRTRQEGPSPCAHSQ